MTKPRYDDQLFARCRKADRRRAQKAARIVRLELSEFIRRAVDDKTTEVFEHYEPLTQEARQSS